MCSSNFFLLAQVIPEIVLSEKPSTLKNLVYSRQMTSYVFVAYLAHYLIEYVHFRASLVKNPPAMLETWVQFLGCGDPPRRRAWQPTPVFLPGDFHGQRSLAGHGVTENWTRLSDEAHQDILMHFKHAVSVRSFESWIIFKNLRTLRDTFGALWISQFSIFWPWIVLSLLLTHDPAADLWNIAVSKRVFL